MGEAAAVALSNDYPRQPGGRFGFGPGRGARMRDAAKHPALHGRAVGGRGLAAQRIAAHANAHGNPKLMAHAERIAANAKVSAHDRAAVHDLYHLYVYHMQSTMHRSFADSHAPESLRRMAREREVMRQYAGHHGIDLKSPGRQLSEADHAALAGHVERVLAREFEAHTTGIVRQTLKGERDLTARLKADIAAHPENIDNMPVGGEGLRAERALHMLTVAAAREGRLKEAQPQIAKLRKAAEQHAPEKAVGKGSASAGDDVHELMALHSLYAHELAHSTLTRQSHVRLVRESAVIRSYLHRHQTWPRADALSPMPAEQQQALVEGVHKGLVNEGSQLMAEVKRLGDYYEQRIVLGETGADGFRRSWIMLMPQGEFEHPQYGDIKFDEAKLKRFKAHFDKRVRKIDIALDADHLASAEKPDSRATGWIERLAFGDEIGKAPGLWGEIKWTQYGVDFLLKEIYKYFSPEFGTYTDEATGEEFKDVIIGGALTNRPFLKVMPAIALREQQGGTKSMATKPARATKNPVDDYDADDISDATAFDESDDEAMDDADDSEAYDESDDEAMDESDDEAMSSRKASVKASSRKASTKASVKASESSDYFQMQETLRQQNIKLQEMERREYTRSVEDMMRTWGDGKTVQLSEVRAVAKNPAGGVKTMRTQRVAATPKALQAIRDYFLSDGVKLSESGRGKVVQLVNTLLTESVVELGARGGSFDQEQRRTIRGGSAGEYEEKVATVQEAAMALAQKDGKDLSKLVGPEAQGYWALAETETGIKL